MRLKDLRMLRYIKKIQFEVAKLMTLHYTITPCHPVADYFSITA